MASQDDSCRLNSTEADIRDNAFTSAVSGVVCLLFSLVGLAVEIIFIAYKKNTFLLRLIVYLSLSGVAVVGSQAFHILIYLSPKNEPTCQILDTVGRYFIAVELSLTLSIVLVLLYKICSSFRFNQCSTILKVNELKRKGCLEALLFVLNLGIPAVAFLIYFVALQNSGTCFYTIKHTSDCYGKGVGYWVFDLVLPLVLMDGFVVVLCVCVFLAWLCWLRSRLFLKTRMKIVMKEIGVWLVFFVLYFAGGILLEFIHVYTLVVQSLVQSCIFIVFFVYICICLCSCKQKTEVHHSSKNHGSATSIQTDKFYGTNPPSTRVSLPSDTAAHAPDFLSPSGEQSL